jgi:hypothetical protein
MNLSNLFHSTNSNEETPHKNETNHNIKSGVSIFANKLNPIKL